MRQPGGFRNRLATLALTALLFGLLGSGISAAAVRHVPQDFPTIQSAINAGVDGDTVLIAPGTYRGPGNRDIEFHGKGIVVTSSNGPEETTIDCEDAGRGFYVHEWESTDTRIQNLTVVNGNANGDYGGGICCDIASPMILNCRIYNCRARGGGGIALLVFGGAVSGCVVSGNWTDDGGGGICANFCGAVTISNCIITGNTTTGIGGGGVAFQDSSPNTLHDCTIAANTSGNYAGGVYANYGVLVDHTIIWGNCAPVRGRELASSEGVTRFVCADIDTSGLYTHWGTFEFDNSISADPQFCAPLQCSQTADGDWWLSADSPCLPEHSPCGERIGALDQGCGPSGTFGACCLPDGTCSVLSRQECEGQQGTYAGDHTSCEPDPCHPTAIEVMSWGRIKSRFGGR